MPSDDLPPTGIDPAQLEAARLASFGGKRDALLKALDEKLTDLTSELGANIPGVIGADGKLVTEMRLTIDGRTETVKVRRDGAAIVMEWPEPRPNASNNVDGDVSAEGVTSAVPPKAHWPDGVSSAADVDLATEVVRLRGLLKSARDTIAGLDREVEAGEEQVAAAKRRANEADEARSRYQSRLDADLKTHTGWEAEWLAQRGDLRATVRELKKSLNSAQADASRWCLNATTRTDERDKAEARRQEAMADLARVRDQLGRATKVDEPGSWTPRHGHVVSAVWVPVAESVPGFGEVVLAAHGLDVTEAVLTLQSGESVWVSARRRSTNKPMSVTHWMRHPTTPILIGAEWLKLISDQVAAYPLAASPVLKAMLTAAIADTQ